MGTLDLFPADVADYRRLAEKKLPRRLFDYYDGGAYDEITLRRNEESFKQIRLKQRVMRDVSSINTGTEVFGASYAMPVALAPIGMSGMAARRGEAQAKRAADAANIPFCLSTVSICSVEEIASVSEKPFWFQLYMLKDRGVVSEMLERVRAAGVDVLVFTVDLAVLGARRRDIRNGMTPLAGPWATLRAGALSYAMHPQWTFDVGVSGKPHTFGNLESYVPKASTPNDFQGWVASQFDASVTWKDIEWLRSIWKGKLIIKGVLSAEDASSAVSAGADGVVVSNHGGRQLDGVSSGIEVVPSVANAIGGDALIIVDGGVRSGLDVVKARASGADMVMMGRPWLYALAARGQAGISAMLASFKGEMTVAMGLTGVTSLGEISKDIIE